MTAPSTDAIVIGGGVSGLTTAACLEAAGYSVRVWAADEVVKTTSYTAGAIYTPFMVEDERVTGWAEHTFGKLRELASDDRSGVTCVFGREVSRTGEAPPEWAKRVEGFRLLTGDELPEHFASGWCYKVPLAYMPVYLTYLENLLEKRHVPVERRRAESLEEALAEASVVVNCTGNDANKLLRDPNLRPVRGDILVVRNPGIKEFVAEYSETEQELTYVLPHRDFVSLGGTAYEVGDETPSDEEIRQGILQRCIAIEKRLDGLEVVEHRIGRRPMRDRVRVECESRDDGKALIHNYGHGGAGVSLSWGCANEVVELLRRHQAGLQPALSAASV